jgi:hypothetical protein
VHTYAAIASHDMQSEAPKSPAVSARRREFGNKRLDCHRAFLKDRSASSFRKPVEVAASAGPANLKRLRTGLTPVTLAGNTFQAARYGAAGLFSFAGREITHRVMSMFIETAS